MGSVLILAAWLLFIAAAVAYIGVPAARSLARSYARAAAIVRDARADAAGGESR